MRFFYLNKSHHFLNIVNDCCFCLEDPINIYFIIFSNEIIFLVPIYDSDDFFSDFIVISYFFFENSSEKFKKFIFYFNFALTLPENIIKNEKKSLQLRFNALLHCFDQFYHHFGVFVLF